MIIDTSPRNVRICFMNSFESITERPRALEFDPREVDLIRVPMSPEADRGCLVQSMHAANAGSGAAREAIDSTVVATKGSDSAMVCGRCAITLVRDSGVVYGARKCPLVRSGETTLGELA